MVCSSGPISGVWQPLQADREETLAALYHCSSSPRGDGDGEDASSSTDEHSPLLQEEKEASSRRKQQQQPRSQSQLRSSLASSAAAPPPPPPQSGHSTQAPGVAADRRDEDDRWRLRVEASTASAWP